MRTPMKGKPDFTTISNERLNGFIDLAQQMIFTYKYCDEEKVRVMTEVWKDLSTERTERLCNEPFIEPEKEAPVPVHKVKMVKPLKRIKR